MPNSISSTLNSAMMAYEYWRLNTRITPGLTSSIPPPATPDVIRGLNWDQRTELIAARNLLNSRQVTVREEFYLHQQQMVEVADWIQEHVDDYPSWRVEPGFGFLRHYFREATEEELNTARDTVTRLEALDVRPIAPTTTPTGDTIQWRRPVEIGPLTNPAERVSYGGRSISYMVVDDLVDDSDTHVVEVSTMDNMTVYQAAPTTL